MAVLNVKTIKAQEVWRTPDGQRVITEVTLDYEGKEFRAKTYSNAIGKVGFEGDIESYEKQGRQGIETFVKQPAKEGNFSGGGQKYPKKDEAAIQAMWAITKAIEWAANDKSVKFEEIEALAGDFNQMVDRVKTGETIKPEKQALDEIFDDE